jgi:zinc protease
MIRRLLCVAMLPLGTLWGQAPAPAEGLVSPSSAPLPSYKNLKFPPLRKITLPNPVTFELPNGMKVFLLENHELPLVSGTALVRTGNLFDPPGKQGVADITGMVMRTGGSGGKTGEQLDAELENIAASVESRIGETSGSVSFSCLKENTAEVLGIFKDVLSAPEFRQDQVDLAKTQWRSSIARRNDDPGGIAQREFAGLVYGKDTPYGWDINYVNIDAIQRADLVTFYRRYFYPKNIMLAVYGDFDSAEMRARIEKVLGSWQYGPEPAAAFPEVVKKPAPGIFLAEKADVTQTFFEMGHLAGTLRDKDLPALSVAADILGGGFSSRLMRRVRTGLGYAYDISANWGADYDHPGLFIISGSTQSKYTEATFKVIREEVEKMRTAEVTDQELKTAKDSVENSFVFLFDSPSKTLVRMLTYAYFDYPNDFIFQYQKGIAAVTKADVLRVAKEYWRPDAFTVVAVGNPRDFGTPLSALGSEVHKIDLTIPEDGPAAQAPAAPQAIAKGKALLGRVREALGGESRLAAIRDATVTTEGTLQSPGGEVKVAQESLFLAPDTLRQERQMPFGKQVVFSDGKTGWIASGGKVMDMPPAVVEQARQQVFRQLFWLALSDRDPDRAIAAEGAAAVRISGRSGDEATLELDEKTSLPAKVTYSTAGSGEVVESYSDWRDVNGYKLPFAITIQRDGQPFAVLQVKGYRFNAGLKTEDLAKKP